MKMNKLAIAVGAAVLAMSSVAQAEVSANIGVTSNYMWRGWTQNGDEAAVSGGIDYAHDEGFYLGTWTSSLGGGSSEIDLYGGFGGEMGDVGFDVGVTRYIYTKGAPADFTEVYGSLSYSMFTAGLAYTADADVKAAEGDMYYYLSAGADIAEGWSLGGTLGYYDPDAAGGLDYNHLTLDLTKSAGDFGDFTMSLSKASTDVPGGDDGVIPYVSWSKSF